MHKNVHTAAKRRRRRNGKIGTLILSFLVLAMLASGATVAYLSKQTEGVVNTFIPGKVTCEVTEEFDGTVKKDVNVKNTGNTDAYIRVKLVTYRVNDNGDRIGGTAEIPAFTPGDGWFEKDGFYYYQSPVAPEEQPVTALINRIELKNNYDGADGGKQVIEVMAEAIQSTPATAVTQSWGVTVATDGTISK